MKKQNYSYYIYLFFIIATVAGVIIYYYTNNEAVNQNDSEAERLSAEVNSLNQNVTAQEEEYKRDLPVETQISSYATDIKDKSSGRLTNIRITCETLNGRVVSPGETFSFESIVTPVTEEKGYQKAKIIENGETAYALGGGNCQVSSTLYNAVLECSEKLTVVERHPHGKKVNYVPEGRDAAVSHGSQDFKFRNDTENKIKMYLSSDNKTVSVTLVRIK